VSRQEAEETRPVHTVLSPTCSLETLESPKRAKPPRKKPRPNPPEIVDLVSPDRPKRRDRQRRRQYQPQQTAPANAANYQYMTNFYQMMANATPQQRTALQKSYYARLQIMLQNPAYRLQYVQLMAQYQQSMMGRAMQLQTPAATHAAQQPHQRPQARQQKRSAPMFNPSVASSNPASVLADTPALDVEMRTSEPVVNDIGELPSLDPEGIRGFPFQTSDNPLL